MYCYAAVIHQEAGICIGVLGVNNLGSILELSNKGEPLSRRSVILPKRSV